MCTAISLCSGDQHHFFGRTMDINQGFMQSPLITPRNYSRKNLLEGGEVQNHYAMMGMGTVMGGHPMYAEAMNEKGLACAGLNFPHYAHFQEKPQEGKLNLPPYDLILWILGQHATVAEVKEEISQVVLVNHPFAPNVPVPPLHWMVTDTTGAAITIEFTKEKMTVHDNYVGIMANSPTFDWHLTNLNQYCGLSSHLPESTTWGQQNLLPQGDGLGLFGIPGDSYTSSRFIRAAYLRNHINNIETKEQALAGFFHILNNLSMISGTVTTPNGGDDITLYSATMDLDDMIYYYKTYENHQIRAVKLTEKEMNATELVVFPYENKEEIKFQN